MNWLAGLLSKIISSLGTIGLQAFISWIKEKYDEHQKNKKIDEAAKKFKEAKNEKDKEKAFDDLINNSRTD